MTLRLFYLRMDEITILLSEVDRMYTLSDRIRWILDRISLKILPIFFAHSAIYIVSVYFPYIIVYFPLL